MSAFKASARFDVIVSKMKDLDKLRNKMDSVARAQDHVSATGEKINNTSRRMANANGKASSSFDKLRNATGRTRNSMGQFVSETNKVKVSLTSIASSLHSTIGLFGTLAATVGATKLWDATAGAAMRMEYDRNAIGAIMKDPKRTKEANDFLLEKQMNSMASLEDWYLGGKSMAAQFKDDIGGFKESMGLIERLAIHDPEQGFSGAAFAMREALGDPSMNGFKSIVERFELDKGVIKSAQKEADAKGLSSREKQMYAINKALEFQGITQEYINKQMDTSLGQWTKFKARVSTTLMKIGESSLKYLQPLFKSFNDWLDGDKVNSLAEKWGTRFGKGVEFVIKSTKKLIDMKPQFIKFFEETKQTLEPVLSKMKDYRDITKKLIDHIKTEGIPAMERFNELLQDNDSTVGKLWDTYGGFLTTLILVNGALKTMQTLGILGFLGSFGKKLGGVGKIAGGGAKNFGSLLTVLALLKGSGMKNVGKGLGTIFKHLSGKGLKGLWKGMRLFVGTKGIWGFIIAVLIEIGFWVAENTDKIKKWGDSIKKFFLPAWDMIKGKWNELKQHWNDFKNSIMNSNFVKIIKDWWAEDGAYIMERFGVMKQAALDAWGRIKEGWGMAWDYAKTKWEEFSSSFKTFWDNLMITLDPILTQLKEAWTPISTAIQTFVDMSKPVLEGFFNGVKTASENALKGFLNYLTGMIALITGDLPTAKTQFIEAMGQMGEAGDGATKGILKGLGNIDGKLTGSLATNLLTAASNFGTFSSNSILALSPLHGLMGSISDLAGTIANKLSNLKVPDLTMPAWLSGNSGGGEKKARFGEAYVAYDEKPYLLHEGERVLTKSENRAYTQAKYSQGSISSGGGINIAKLADSIVIREEADIDRLAVAFAREINKAGMAGA